MLTSELHSSLIYLDRDFIAGTYEIASGNSPSSQITRTQGKKAGAALPIFSAEVSAVETRTFPVSTLEMLANVLPTLQTKAALDPSSLSLRMSSQVGWVNATLSTLTAFPSTGIAGSPTYEKGEQQGCFTLSSGQLKFSLITTPDYFVSGLDALLKMHKVLVHELSIPVRALLRVIAARDHMQGWIAVPYVIHERRDA